jgi:homocysteine S-methyltransferase
VAASLTFTRELYPGNGGRPEQSLAVLVRAGASIVGANCSQGPEQLSQLHGSFARVIGRTPVSLMPNAGWPEEAAGRIKYPASPIYFAEFAEAMSVRKSVRILGGCCGTTPEHIAAMRQAIDHPRRSARRVQSRDIARRPTADLPSAPRRRSSVRMPTSLGAALAGGRFPLCVEFSPPHGFLTDRSMAAIRGYHQAGADVVNVADSPLARMRMSPWAVCHRIQNELGIETVLHFPTRGRNLLRVQGDLLAAHALGVRNVFVVMGDPPSVGDYPEAMGDFDLAPSGLIQLITRGFNAGADHAGAHLGGQTAFFVGCALDLGADDLPRELRVLHRKVSAGAHFALTQPVFEPEILDRFLRAYADRYGPLALPVLVGILPLLNERHARFLDNEVPGIRIPAGILERLAGSRAPRQTGLQIALETIQAVGRNAGGIYLIPPQADAELGIELLKAARRLGLGRKAAPGTIRRASHPGPEVRHDRKRSRRA